MLSGLFERVRICGLLSPIVVKTFSLFSSFIFTILWMIGLLPLALKMIMSPTCSSSAEVPSMKRMSPLLKPLLRGNFSNCSFVMSNFLYFDSCRCHHSSKFVKIVPS